MDLFKKMKCFFGIHFYQYEEFYIGSPEMRKIELFFRYYHRCKYCKKWNMDMQIHEKNLNCSLFKLKK